jgi:hypothetical protein
MAVADQFWLTNASIVGAKAGDATKPPDTVGTSGAAGLSYELTGEKEAELKTHLNKKVEIKGRLMSADPTAAAPTGSPRAAKVPRLTIESFKPLNEECPAK